MRRRQSRPSRIKLSPSCLANQAGRRSARRSLPGIALLAAAILASLFGSAGLPPTTFAQDAGANDAAGQAPPALRIVTLLWKTQPQNAAAALEKVIDQAITRHQAAQLRPHLVPLDERLKESLSDPADVRWVASVAAVALYDAKAATDWIEAGVSGFKSGKHAREVQLSLAQRDFLLRVWLETDRSRAIAYVHQELAAPIDDAKEGAAWLETVALRGLQADLEATARQLVDIWPRLPKSVQVAAIEPLSQQAVSMHILIESIASGKISKDLLNTNQLLKWTSSNDAELTAGIERIWGKVRMSDDGDRKEVVAKTLAMLQSGKAGNPVAGQQTFKRVCSQCHRLHGEGIEVGPDISVNGRGSFEQLVSNVMDPSLVIGKAFLAKTVLTTDGRVLAGLVAAEDPRRLTLKIQGGKLVELDREEDIEEIKDSSKSLMPDGLEQQMSEQELVDLFAYLSLTKPLSAPENDTIPGTPASLIAQ